MSTTIINFDQTIYDEYFTFVDTDNLALSAYNIFKHFFTKFKDVSTMEDKKQVNFQYVKKQLSRSMSILYDIYNYYSKVVFLKNINKINDPLSIEKGIDHIMKHMGTVDYIIKNEIFKLTENYKKNIKAYEKDEFWNRNIYNEYVLQKQSNQYAVNVLQSNLVCKDISNCVYQYL